MEGGESNRVMMGIDETGMAFLGNPKDEIKW
jgi:hypothetical protein